MDNPCRNPGAKACPGSTAYRSCAVAGVERIGGHRFTHGRMHIHIYGHSHRRPHNRGKHKTRDGENREKSTYDRSNYHFCNVSQFRNFSYACAQRQRITKKLYRGPKISAMYHP